MIVGYALLLLSYMLVSLSSGADAQDSILHPEVVASLDGATSFSIDPAGVFYVADARKNTVQKISPKGIVLATSGGYGWEDEAMDRPRDISAANGLDVYIADHGNHRILRFNRNLDLISKFDGGLSNSVRTRAFGYPNSIAVSRFGWLFIIDGDNQRIVKLSETGEVDVDFLHRMSGKGRLHNPRRIRINSQDRLFIRDARSILVYDLFGNFLFVLVDGLMNDFSPFAVDDSSVFVLEGCRVLRFGSDGRPGNTMMLDSGCEDILDIQVHQGSLYLLTRRTLLRAPLHSHESGNQQE